MSNQSYPRFGPYLKQLRLERRITLRDFAKRSGIDVGYLSRVERGVVTPPQHPEALEKLSEALEIESGGPKWSNLVDYGSVDNAAVPDDLMRRKPLANLLPFCFSKFRQMTDEQFKAFTQKLLES
jgi:transcriptional regulator with XRE-family HTH domain